MTVVAQNVRKRKPRSSADRPFDVAVVGAGAAGLAVARALREADRSFVVLEAKDRAGGRAICESGRGNGAGGDARAFPLGAEFIHGEGAETKRLLAEYGATFYEVEPDFHVWEKRRLRPSPHYWDVLSRAFARIHKTAHDRSFSEFLRGAHLTADQSRLAASFVEGFNAAELSRISANALKDASAQVNDPEMRKFARPVGGYGPFFERWAADFRREIRYGHAVREIRRHADGAEILAEHGRRTRKIRARRAIVTVPIGVLRQGARAIRFAPAIPNFAHRLARIEMGDVVRIALDFEPKPFTRWTRKFPEGFPFVASPDLAFMTWWSERPLRWPTITAWAGGDHAVRLRDVADSERVSRALADLSRILRVSPTALRRGLRGFHHHDWTSDPYARGAYSYPGVDSADALESLRRPVDGVLFFAGEAFDPDQSGTVEGAIANGRAQARKLLRSLAKKRG